MTQEEHEEYKARLLQKNKEYQQYEMGDFIIADEDGEKWIAKIRPTHYGVKTPDLYVKVPDRQARLWENAKKLLELIKDTVNNYEKEYAYLLEGNIQRAKKLIAEIEGESEIADEVFED